MFIVSWCGNVYDMRVKYFLTLVTLFSSLVPNGLNCLQSCNSITLNIPMGSEVLLPCTLLKSNQTEEARWSQISSLLTIRPNGNVTFVDPRDGRMIVFPFLFDRGNFSILVHQFQASDLGVYCCQLTHECHRIEIKLSQNPEGHKGGFSVLWYYSAAGAGIFILLVIIFSLIWKFRGKCLKTSTDSYQVNRGHNHEQREARHRERAECIKVDDCDGEYEDIDSDTHEADYENASGEEHDDQYEDTMSEKPDEDYVNTERRNGEDQHDDIDNEYPAKHHVETRMQGNHSRISIYENDEHDPNRKEKVPPKAFRKMPKKRPNSEELYYANQSEINKSARNRNRNKNKAEYQFKNPLYDQTLAQK